MTLEKFYWKSPVQVQNILISAYGYYWKIRRYGGVFKNELESFIRRDFYTKTDWQFHQDKLLNKILKHAYQNVPYYKTSFTKTGLSQNNIRNIRVTDLGEIPILTKDDLREFGRTSIVSKRLEKRGQFYPSSGSTGTPTNILFSYAMHQRWSAAFEARIRYWAGVDKEIPRGMIGGRRVVPEGNGKPPYFRFNSFEKQTYFSAYHISNDTCHDYLEGMVKHGVEYMTGYAFSNYSLARFIKENNLQAPKMKAVITSSEKLTAEMRSVLEEVYQCKCYDSYSGLEACGLISECEKGSLHISPDVGIMEIVKEDGTYAQPGESGELICTGLLNFDQPLIRYQIGDRVKLSQNQQCECGRAMPIVEEIMGRTEDVIKGLDGREMVRFHGIFIDLPNLLEGQIIQNDLYSIKVNAVAKGKLSSEENNLIKDRLQSQLGNINVEIEEVKEIPRGPNGKFQAVISKINQN